MQITASTSETPATFVSHLMTECWLTFRKLFKKFHQVRLLRFLMALREQQRRCA